MDDLDLVIHMTWCDLIILTYFSKESSAARHMSEPVFNENLVYKFKRIIGK